MAITSESVREIFKGLENGDGGAFFERVSQPAGYRCRRGGVPARLRGFEFFLSSFPNVGRDDTLPVEGRAQTTC
jgi:hypothetical protein